MRHTRRHRGFTLIIAAAMIPLVGFAVIITTANTAQLSQRLRAVERHTEQKNLLLSAEAWLRVNRAAVFALDAGNMLAVPVDGVASERADCIATVVERDDTGMTVLLTLTFEHFGRAVTTEQTLRLVAAN